MQNSYTRICERRVTDGKTEYRYELMLCYKSIGGSAPIPIYSISAEMIINGIRTFYRTGDLFTCEKKARSFFDKITEKLATPLNMPYVIEDELS